MSRTVRVLPVTRTRWPDMQRLFSSKGCPGYCWCAPYRFRDAHAMDRGAKEEAMRALVASGTPVGVLAYDGDEPIGWCSVAPRESYAKLERSTVMPPVADPGEAWTLLCLFIRRGHRGEGVAHQLAKGAIARARRFRGPRPGGLPVRHRRHHRHPHGALLPVPGARVPARRKDAAVGPEAALAGPPGWPNRRALAQWIYTPPSSAQLAPSGRDWK